MATRSPAAVELRTACKDDLPAIIALLADDPLGSTRESGDNHDAYLAAFAAIDADPNNLLLVASEHGASDGPTTPLLGVLQLTFIPNLTYQGAWRAQIEGVRVAPTHRNAGIGKQMVQWAVDHARARRCGLLQLTTDKSRPEALAFYQRLGFLASHEGMKLHL